MNVHEYQAKEILAKSGVSVQRGITASDKDQAVNAAIKLNRNKNSCYKGSSSCRRKGQRRWN